MKPNGISREDRDKVVDKITKFMEDEENIREVEVDVVYDFEEYDYLGTVNRISTGSTIMVKIERRNPELGKLRKEMDKKGAMRIDR